MGEMQDFESDELSALYRHVGILRKKCEVLKGVIGNLLEDIPNNEIVVWSPESWDVAQATRYLNIEEINCSCCEEKGMRFYLDLEN